MSKIFTIILSMTLAMACGKDNSAKDAMISGKISNGEGNSIYLEHLSASGVTPLDTTSIGKNGNYSFDYIAEEIGFFRIKKDERNYITFIIGEGEKVSIDADWEKFTENYSVKGSKDSEILMTLNSIMKSAFMQKDSLNKLYQNNSGDQQMIMQLQNEFMLIDQNLKAKSREMLDENPGSFANLALIEQLSPEEDMKYYDMIDEELGKKYPDSPYYKSFHGTVANLKKLAVGSEAPEIMLPDPDGNMVTLSSFRGKVVLVDFWASWCRPCRAENPNVVRAYEKYKDKGFEIVGVSLDKDRNSWLKAINDDGLTWTHVSDLKFWNSSVVKLFDIKGIPFALLLDEEGKIIAKNLRGQQLEDKLEEVLQ